MDRHHPPARCRYRQFVRYRHRSHKNVPCISWHRASDRYREEFRKSLKSVLKGHEKLNIEIGWTANLIEDGITLTCSLVAWVSCDPPQDVAIAVVARQLLIWDDSPDEARTRFARGAFWFLGVVFSKINDYRGMSRHFDGDRRWWRCVGGGWWGRRCERHGQILFLVSVYVFFQNGRLRFLIYASRWQGRERAWLAKVVFSKRWRLLLILWYGCLRVGILQYDIIEIVWWFCWDHGNSKAGIVDKGRIVVAPFMHGIDENGWAANHLCSQLAFRVSKKYKIKPFSQRRLCKPTTHTNKDNDLPEKHLYTTDIG